MFLLSRIKKKMSNGPRIYTLRASQFTSLLRWTTKHITISTNSGCTEWAAAIRHFSVSNRLGWSFNSRAYSASSI